jgi:hypothetical protein
VQVAVHQQRAILCAGSGAGLFGGVRREASGDGEPAAAVRVQGDERQRQAVEVVGLCDGLPDPVPDEGEEVRSGVRGGSDQVTV